MSHNVKKKLYTNILTFLVYAAAIFTVCLLISLIGYIFVRGIPHISWPLLSEAPVYLEDTIGILPNIMSTIYVIFLTLLIALPLGVGAAVYLTEYAKNKKMIAAVEFATETLSGIPSIIYGLVGYMFFCIMLELKVSLLAGSLTMAIVILPTIIRTTQESLKTVPASYREGAQGLGATKWYMIRTIVLPSSINGIITGCILAIGRIVGESAALLFTAGVGTAMAKSVGQAYSSSGGTLSVALYMYAHERAEFDVAFAIGAVLLILVLFINAATRLTKRAFNKDKK